MDHAGSRIFLQTQTQIMCDMAWTRSWADCGLLCADLTCCVCWCVRAGSCLLLPTSIVEEEGKVWLCFPRGCLATLDAYMARHPCGLAEDAQKEMVSRSPGTTSTSMFCQCTLAKCALCVMQAQTQYAHNWFPTENLSAEGY